jgi:heat shock protein HslJ
MRAVARSLVALSLALGVAACVPRPPGAAAADAEPPTAMPDSSRTSVDWEGSYRGVVPCADCEGIDTEITLRGDSTYVLWTRYLGTDDAGAEWRGTFAWDAAGATITLAGIADGPSRYLVGENVLVQLDRNGQRITGGLADRYRLAKAVPTALVGTTWKLVELEGRPLPAVASEQVPRLRLVTDGAQVQGFGGCNNFTGGFEAVEAQQRLRFSRVASTLRACPEIETEAAFLRALGTVDNYAIRGTTLSLAKARMAPLLRFEAVIAP